MLRNSTPRSLLLIDEFGKGTQVPDARKRHFLKKSFDKCSLRAHVTLPCVRVHESESKREREREREQEREYKKGGTRERCIDTSHVCQCLNPKPSTLNSLAMVWRCWPLPLGTWMPGLTSARGPFASRTSMSSLFRFLCEGVTERERGTTRSKKSRYVRCMWHSPSSMGALPALPRRWAPAKLKYMHVCVCVHSATCCPKTKTSASTPWQ